MFSDYVAVKEPFRNGSYLARTWYIVGLGGLVVLGLGVLMPSASGQLALQNILPDP